MPRVLIVLLLSAVLAHADLKIDLVTKYGCHISQGEGGTWILDVWAKQDPDPDYKLLYSVRAVRDKSMKECSAWMDEVKRQLDLKNNPKSRRKK